MRESNVGSDISLKNHINSQENIEFIVVKHNLLMHLNNIINKKGHLTIIYVM